VRSGSQAGIRVSLLSYNHPVYWLQRSAPPNTYFHVEVANDALIDRFAEIEAVYPGGMLHVEAAHEFPIGMLVAPFVSAEEVVAGYERLRQLDVLVHSPHEYYVDFNVAEARALKAQLDPAGLLNPGKLV
jgi:FAD/FMN-containing dehydrogenase